MSQDSFCAAILPLSSHESLFFMLGNVAVCSAMILTLVLLTGGSVAVMMVRFRKFRLQQKRSDNNKAEGAAARGSAASERRAREEREKSREAETQTSRGRGGGRARAREKAAGRRSSAAALPPASGPIARPLCALAQGWAALLHAAEDAWPDAVPLRLFQD